MWCVCRYSALKSLSEKKQCFNEYVQLRANEEKDEARARIKGARDQYQKLLEERCASRDLKPGLRYEKARDFLAEDSRFKVRFPPAIPLLVFGEKVASDLMKDFLEILALWTRASRLVRVFH